MWGALNAQPGMFKNDQEVGDLYSIREFQDMCVCGAITPHDGNGYLASATHFNPGSSAFLSMRPTKPSWATHVMWFNK